MVASTIIFLCKTFMQCWSSADAFSNNEKESLQSGTPTRTLEIQPPKQEMLPSSSSASIVPAAFCRSYWRCYCPCRYSNKAECWAPTESTTKIWVHFQEVPKSCLKKILNFSAQHTHNNNERWISSDPRLNFSKWGLFLASPQPRPNPSCIVAAIVNWHCPVFL